MTKRDIIAVFAVFLALWVGLEAGYRIGSRDYAAPSVSGLKRREMPAYNRGHKDGWDACMEQF